MLFAPDHAPELEIVKQMLKAKLSAWTSRSSPGLELVGIDDAMSDARPPEAHVSGVLDPRQGASHGRPRLAASTRGVKVFRRGRENGFRKLHHKLMVIKDATVVAGSFNYAPTPTTSTTREHSSSAAPIPICPRGRAVRSTPPPAPS